MPPSVGTRHYEFSAHTSPALISLPPPPSLIPVPRPSSTPPVLSSPPSSSALPRTPSDINDRTRLRFSTHSEEVIYDIDAPSASSLRPDITATRSPPTKIHSQEPNHRNYSKRVEKFHPPSTLPKPASHIPINDLRLHTLDIPKLIAPFKDQSVPPSETQDSLQGRAESIIAGDLTSKSHQRNLARLQDAISKDALMLQGEFLSPSDIPSPSIAITEVNRGHLPNDVSLIFTETLHPPPKRPPTRKLSAALLKQIADSSCPTPSPSPFQYEDSLAAAQFNSKLIEQHGYDLQAVFDAHKNSTISPGSEFRHPSTLEPILGGHPNWNPLRSTLLHGATFPLLHDEDETARKQENEAMLAYGNHSSAVKNQAAHKTAIQKDTARGYSFPLTIECAKKIKHGRIAPTGIANQLGIDEKGELIPKNRLTHDQTVTKGFCPSVNQLIDQLQLTQLVYGHCLPRIIHQVVALRYFFPALAILLGKYDWSKAYRRKNSSGRAAAQSLTIDATGKYAHCHTRLTFGGAANPSIFSDVTEAATDLANDIAAMDDWDPSVCQSPLQSGVGTPIIRPPDEPFAVAAELSVAVELRPKGYHDVFLDDMLQLFLATPENLNRSPAIIPLVMHLLTRPVADDEPILREVILESKKLEAEGTPIELQRILGWMLDTRKLLLSLPSDKYIAWLREVTAFIKARYISWSNCESLIGKLDHSILGMPLARFFLRRIRAFHYSWQDEYNIKEKLKWDQKETVPKTKYVVKRPPPFYTKKIPPAVQADIRVFVPLLKQSHAGVSLNLLVHRKPTHSLHADSCPEGFGGFSVGSGKAWRVQLDPAAYALAYEGSPSESHDDTQDTKTTNNLYEYIGIVVTIWMEHLDGLIPPESMVLAASDSTSACGWMHRASYGMNKPIHAKVTKKLVDLVVPGRYGLMPEHFEGDINNISDYLSRRWDLSDTDLTSLLIKKFPSQIPANFHICRLPNEMLSWISEVAPRLLVSSTEKSNPPTKNKTAPGDAGSGTLKISASMTIPSSIASNPETSEPLSSAPSSNASVMASGAEALRRTLRQALSKKPLATWHRGSGITTGQAPATSRTDSPFTLSYPPLRKRGKTWIRPKNASPQSQSSTSSICGQKRAPPPMANTILRPSKQRVQI
jgi:hypothetical protein